MTARKLSIPQLFLSLDIPSELIAGSSQGLVGGHTLLLLEKGIVQTFRESILPSA